MRFQFFYITKKTDFFEETIFSKENLEFPRSKASVPSGAKKNQTRILQLRVHRETQTLPAIFAENRFGRFFSIFFDKNLSLNWSGTNGDNSRSQEWLWAFQPTSTARISVREVTRSVSLSISRLKRPRGRTRRQKRERKKQQESLEAKKRGKIGEQRRKKSSENKTKKRTNEFQVLISAKIAKKTQETKRFDRR